MSYLITDLSPKRHRPTLPFRALNGPKAGTSSELKSEINTRVGQVQALFAKAAIRRCWCQCGPLCVPRRRQQVAAGPRAKQQQRHHSDCELDEPSLLELPSSSLSSKSDESELLSSSSLSSLCNDVIELERSKQRHGIGMWWALHGGHKSLLNLHKRRWSCGSVNYLKWFTSKLPIRPHSHGEGTFGDSADPKKICVQKRKLFITIISISLYSYLLCSL